MKAAKSNIPKGSSTGSKLIHLQRRLESWRSRQSKRGPLPEWAWVDAVQAARVEGVSRVSRALSLDYYKLKRRVGEPERNQRIDASATGFVELQLAARPEPVEACTIELSDPRGRRLIIQAPSQPTSWVALARTLWEQGQ